MSQLTEYLAGLSKDKIDAFASEYFGVQLDKRQTKDVMINTLAEAAVDKTPLKQLPYEELLLEQSQDSTVVEEVVLDGATKVEDSEPAVVVDETTIEVGETIASDVADNSADVASSIDNGTTNVTSESIIPGTESGTVEPANVDSTILFKPCFELGFKNGADKFAVISYQVTDFLDKLKAETASLAYADSRIAAEVKTAIYYAKRYGSVILRETRNSRFLTYFATDFVSINIE